MSWDSKAARPVVTIHQPEFLPWLGLMDKMRQADLVVLLDSVQFEKHYFQNRNRIRTAWGASWLTVPVLTKGRFGQPISAVEIRNDEPWRRKHCHALVQHYQAAPFAGRHLFALQQLYQEPWDALTELNIAIIRWLAEAFGLSCRFVRSSELGVQGKGSELLRDLCVAVGARVYLSGVSGREYLDERLFDEAGIAIRYQAFHHPVYRQCYEPFLPGMSSVDLLLNVGPESLRVLGEANGVRAGCIEVS